MIPLHIKKFIQLKLVKIVECEKWGMLKVYFDLRKLVRKLIVVNKQISDPNNTITISYVCDFASTSKFDSVGHV